MNLKIIAPDLSRPFAAVWWFGFLSLAAHAFSSVNSLYTAAFLLLAALVQASLFSLPLVPIILLALQCSPQSKRRKGMVVTLYLVSLTIIGFLLTNYKLYSLYGFFTNFFVLNIVSTPGGIEAMGITRSTWVSLITAATVGAFLYILILRYVRLESLLPGAVKKRRLAVAVLVCMFSQSMMYAYAEYESDLSVLEVADRVIWYMPVTAKSLFTSMGIPRVEMLHDDLKASSGKLNYFDAALLDNPVVTAKPNIVWLVAESWRADMVTPEIMPNTYKFAMENQWFQNHYSGGNGTRMGMFTQFYGIYGNYWFDMLRAKQPPLLIEYLQGKDYQLKAFTSSAFTYPEFDKTIFSQFDEEQLQEFNEGEGWQRDQKNTTDLLSFIESASDPFFAFMFFESAHANYYFPDEDIIRPEYLDDFNYLTVDIEEEIDKVKSRYINSVHHLDRQLARVYDSLEKQGLLDNTIVIVTGDHGEEFMENGRWGHNSTFSQQQIRVPLVMHIPSRPGAHFNNMTSHIDLPATMLSLLGLQVAPEVYSHGSDLYSDSYERNYTVVSDWHGNTLVTPQVKIIFSFKGASYHASMTDINDQPLDSELSQESYSSKLADYTRSINRFYN